jgi:predicted transglutaminase-like cysteine proteinase
MSTLAAAAGRVWSEPLLDGDAGTAQTIKLMDWAVDRACRDPLIRTIAGRLVRQLDPMNLAGQARAIWDWFTRSVRFVRDGVGQEVITDAAWTIQNGFGDCDDMVVALRGLLGAVGIVTRTVTVATNAAAPGKPPQFSHVYLEAQLEDGRWIPLDPARPNARFGATSDRVIRRQVWGESGNGDGMGAGLGSVVWGTRSEMGRGLGENGDGIDWGEIAQVIAAGGSAAASIIAASRTNPNLLNGLQARGLYPQSAGMYGQGGLSIGAMSPTTLMLFGGLALVLVLKH